MAIVRRYFSTVAAGAGDGTSWADRAALVSSGNWSSIITGFNFFGSDALECYVGPGTYSITQSFLSSLFANAPRYNNPLYMVACDASGAEWVPPNPNWVSAQPVWDTSGMPKLELDGCSIGEGKTRWEGFYIEVSNLNNAMLSAGNFRWCYGVQASSGTSVSIATSGVDLVNNSAFVFTGSSHGSAASLNVNALENVRFEGNPLATSGARNGFSYALTTTQKMSRLTMINFAAQGFVTSGTADYIFSQCVFANSGGGISLTSVTAESEIRQCVLVNLGDAVSVGAGAEHKMENCLLRGNTLDENFIANVRSGTNFSAGSDAVDFVDAANGDYRIAKESVYWGKGIGAGDEPLSAADIAEAVWTRIGRTLT